MSHFTSTNAPTGAPVSQSVPRSRPRKSRRALPVSVIALTTALTLASCASTPPSTGTDHAAPIEHVHGIIANPTGDGFLLGTHEGIFTATNDGELGARVPGADFDAMGLTAIGDTLLASGHPGRSTPPELGSPNLGIIRSTDNAQTWSPVAFTGEKDFHALTAGPDGTVYGIAADAAGLLVSTDSGTTWMSANDSLFAFSLVVDATGRLIASTPDGIKVSSNAGATFSFWEGAPPLVALSASPDHTRLVGVGSGGRIWVTTTDANVWTEAATAHGTVQAASITDDGALIVFDDSGLTALPTAQHTTQ